MQQLQAARAVKKRKAEERKSLYFIPEFTLQRVDVELETECGLRPEAHTGKQPSVCAHWEDIEPRQNAYIEDIVRYLIRASGNTVKPVWIRIVLSFKHFSKFKHFPSSTFLSSSTFLQA